MRKLLTTLVSAILVMSVLGTFAMTPVSATVGGSGNSRYVEIEIASTNYTTTANLSFPEEISENHTLSGEITHNITDPTHNDTETLNWVNVTFENSTGNTWTFSSGSINLTSNETVDFSIDTDLPTDNYTADLTLENDDAQINDGNTGIDIKVIDDEVFVVSNIMTPVIMVFATIMISLAVLKAFKNMFKDFGEST